MTKTAGEMYTKLKNLESKILNKNRELNNLQKRHRIAGTGTSNVIPFQKRMNMNNKNTYTNSNYKKNVSNAARIVYNDRKPMMNKYNKAVGKYRAISGLSPMGKRGSLYPNRIVFIRSKKIGSPLPDLTNINNMYRPKGLQMSSGGGGGFMHKGITVTPYKFYPNIQLLNTLLMRAKETNIAKRYLKTWRERALRPPSSNGNNKGGSAYLAAKKRFES